MIGKPGHVNGGIFAHLMFGEPKKTTENVLKFRNERSSFVTFYISHRKC